MRSHLYPVSLKLLQRITLNLLMSDLFIFPDGTISYSSKVAFDRPNSGIRIIGKAG